MGHFITSHVKHVILYIYLRYKTIFLRQRCHGKSLHSPGIVHLILQGSLFCWVTTASSIRREDCQKIKNGNVEHIEHICWLCWFTFLLLQVVNMGCLVLNLQVECFISHELPLVSFELSVMYICLSPTEPQLLINSSWDWLKLLWYVHATWKVDLRCETLS